MIKRIILVIAVLGLAGGGLFYWWNNQQDVRELNKTLPEGVKVAKSLVGNEYKVVNKIDGYEFKVPKEWRGVKIIEYRPEETERNRTASGVYLEGGEGMRSIISVDAYKKNQPNIDIEEWAESLFDDYGLSAEFKKDKIGVHDLLSAQEEEHLAGAYIYFLDSSKIYVFTGRLEEFIKYIILNGKW